MNHLPVFAIPEGRIEGGGERSFVETYLRYRDGLTLNFSFVVQFGCQFSVAGFFCSTKASANLKSRP